MLAVNLDLQGSLSGMFMSASFIKQKYDEKQLLQHFLNNATHKRRINLLDYVHPSVLEDDRCGLVATFQMARLRRNEPNNVLASKAGQEGYPISVAHRTSIKSEYAISSTLSSWTVPHSLTPAVSTRWRRAITSWFRPCRVRSPRSYIPVPARKHQVTSRPCKPIPASWPGSS